jgi:hypothetical protein
MEEDKSKEEDDDSSKQEKVDSEWQLEDKEYNAKTGERAIDIIQYNIRRVQNEGYVFFPKVHVWLHISHVTSFATKMKVEVFDVSLYELVN